MIKSLIIISIAANLIAWAFLIAALERSGGVSSLFSRFGFIKQENNLLQKPQYMGRVELLKNMPIGKSQIIMLGDSITAGGEWQEFFPQSKIVNRGIGNDTSTGILNRVDAYLKSYPDKIFLLIGINDLLNEGKVEDVFCNVTRIIDLISKNAPDSKLFIQSVLPCRKDFHVDKKILQLNKKLQSESERRKIAYINLYSRYVGSDGEQLPHLFVSDGIHLSDRGYTMWVEILRPYISQ